MKLSKLYYHTEDILAEYHQLISKNLPVVGGDLYIETYNDPKKIAGIYQDIENRGGAWVERRKNWTTFPLRFKGLEIPSNQKLCPRTMEMVESIDEKIHTVSFSTLTRGELEWHDDIPSLPTETCLVYHLPLKVPEYASHFVFKDPYAIFTYKTGVPLKVNTRRVHNVYNSSSLPRIILYIEYEP